MPPLVCFAQASQRVCCCEALLPSAAELHSNTHVEMLITSLSMFSEACNEFTFFRAKPWRISRCRIFGHASSIAGGRYGDMTARVAQNPLEQSLRPCRHSKGQKR